MSVSGPPKDHVEDNEDPGDQFEDETGNRATGMRLLFMFLMAIIFSLGVTIGTVVVVLQFFWVLFTGETKRELETIGRQLAEYGKDIALYMTFNTDERPFPFDRDWPSV